MKQGATWVDPFMKTAVVVGLLVGGLCGIPIAGGGAVLGAVAATEEAETPPGTHHVEPKIMQQSENDEQGAGSAGEGIPFEDSRPLLMMLLTVVLLTLMGFFLVVLLMTLMRIGLRQHRRGESGQQSKPTDYVDAWSRYRLPDDWQDQQEAEWLQDSADDWDEPNEDGEDDFDDDDYGREDDEDDSDDEFGDEHDDESWR